jgi:hypothetical protein
MKDALCAGHPEPDSWDADASADARHAARRICHACPVMRECAEYGADEPYLIWGATTPAERRAAKLHALKQARGEGKR